jgi:hypothetical protein
MLREWLKRATSRTGASSEEQGTDVLREREEPALREEVREKNLRLKHLRERLEEKDREIEQLRSRLARSAPEDPTSTARQSTPVFFLVGRAKSGTSWLMRTLNAHPEVLCRGEGRLFGRDYKREDIIDMPSKTMQPSSLYRAILDAEYLRAWVERSVWTRDDDRDDHLINLTRVAVNYFLTEKLSKTGKKIVGDKTPFLSEKIVEEIGAIYPGARTIHIIRDGRDVAVSSIHHLWKHSVDLAGHLDLKPEEVEKRDAYHEDPQGFLATGESLFVEERIRSLARNWAEVVGRARKDGPELLGENYAEVRYEELLARPEEELCRLLRFLGADASEGVVGSCVEAGSFERWSKGRERGQEDSVSLLRKGVAGDWRNAFAERDKEIFKEEANDLLMELGYEKVHDW